MSSRTKIHAETEATLVGRFSHPEAEVSEVIDKTLEHAAIALAETLDYARAAEILKLAENDLRAQIARLENQLCISIFKPESGKPELTAEGSYLIGAFRKARAKNGHGHV